MKQLNFTILMATSSALLLAGCQKVAINPNDATRPIAEIR